jgi:pilus assembly protein CpaB
LSSRVRIGIVIGVIGLVLIALGIFIVGQIVRQTLSPQVIPTPEAAITEAVVVTTHNVALGTVFKAEDLRLVDMPVELVPDGGLNNIETVVGKYAKVDLVTGETVLLHNLADPTNISHDVGFTINEDQVLMAFPPNDLMSTLDVLQRGDVVDILVTLSEEVPKAQQAGTIPSGQAPETESYLFTFDAFQRIRVTAMVVDIIEQQQSNQAPLTSGENAAQAQKPPKTQIRAYLLALSAQDALVLKHLKDTGANFDIVLRSPTSNQLFELNNVTKDYLIDRYQLVVPR